MWEMNKYVNKLELSMTSALKFKEKIFDCLKNVYKKTTTDKKIKIIPESEESNYVDKNSSILLSFEWCKVMAGKYEVEGLPEWAREKEPGWSGGWKYSNDASECEDQHIETTGFYISKYPVTNAQFRLFLLANPSWRKIEISNDQACSGYLKEWKGNDYPANTDNYPIVNVSFFAAKAFCEWASRILGYKIELPSLHDWDIARKIENGPFSFWIKYNKVTTVQFTPVNNVPNGRPGFNGNEWSSTYRWTQKSYYIYGWTWYAHKYIKRLLGWRCGNETEDNLSFRVITKDREKENN